MLSLVCVALLSFAPTASLQDPTWVRAIGGATHPTDLISDGSSWVLAQDDFSVPGERPMRLVRVDRAGKVVTDLRVGHGMGPRLGFSGDTFAVVFCDPERDLRSFLRFVDLGLQPMGPVEIPVDGRSTCGAAVTWNPEAKEWAVALAQWGEHVVSLRLRRYSRSGELLEVVDLGQQLSSSMTPSGVVGLFPAGTGYRMVVYPALRVVEWDGVRVRISARVAGDDQAGAARAAVIAAGDALWVTYAEAGATRHTSPWRVWLARVEASGAITQRTLVHQTEVGHGIGSVALAPAPGGVEVFWTDYQDGNPGASLQRAVVTTSARGAVRQLDRGLVQMWSLLVAGHDGASAVAWTREPVFDEQRRTTTRPREPVLAELRR